MPKATPKKVGRPSIDWTPELEEEIARRLINRSLRQICAEDTDLPSRAAINEHLAQSEDFWTKCARARRVHAFHRIESVELDVDACDETNARSTQVKVGYAQWLAERLMAKQYNPKTLIEHSGEVGFKRVISDL